MNCPNDGTLQASVDGELSMAELAELNRHLAECSACRGRLQTTRSEAERVQGALASLAPGRDEAPDPVRALARFRAGMEEENESRHGWAGSLFAPPLRPAWGALALICAVAVFLSVAPARTFAEKILAMLRVKKITVVSVYPNSTELSSNQRTAKLLSQLISDNVVVTEDAGKPQPASNAAAASKLAGFDVRTIGQLGAPQKILVNGEAGFQMTLNRDRMQAILQEAGRSDIQLPASIDGALLAVHIPRTVLVAYGNCPEHHIRHHGPLQQPPDTSSRQSATPDNCVFMVQAPSPTVSVPPNLNISQVAEAAMELAGMSPAEARSFCQTVDWSSTLVVPVPGNVSSYQTVSVDGVSGTLISLPNGQRYSLLWVKDGIIYSLNGHGDPNQALNLAASLTD